MYTSLNALPPTRFTIVFSMLNGRANNADTARMRIIILVLLICLFSFPARAITESQTGLDSNTAFYAGESQNYVVHAPSHFKMVTREAAFDGYSFAFIPEGARYDSTDILIGVNIYRIRGLDFEDILKGDTSEIKKHYGHDIVIRPIDSLAGSDRDKFTSFYFDSPERFIPNVMMTYVDGETEVLIFELVITENALRFAAEDKFVDCLRRLRVLARGELGMR
jgi:hypothetical protein